MKWFTCTTTALIIVRSHCSRIGSGLLWHMGTWLDTGYACTAKYARDLCSTDHSACTQCIVEKMKLIYLACFIGGKTAITFMTGGEPVNTQRLWPRNVSFIRLLTVFRLSFSFANSSLRCWTLISYCLLSTSSPTDEPALWFYWAGSFLDFPIQDPMEQVSS